MKGIMKTTIIAGMSGFALLLAFNFYMKNQEKHENEAMKEILTARFDPYELRPFTDLRPEVLGKWQKVFLNMDLRDKHDVLITCTFSTLTEWPTSDRMPAKFSPLEIIEMGKDPGLGIRELHRQGITGKGVRVAIMDFPLFREHNEYRGRIAQVRLTNDKDPMSVDERQSSMHGAAVSSLLLGKSCGVAPEADLYYWANTEAALDYQPNIFAVEEALSFNRNRPKSEKIRVMSISQGISSGLKNYKAWVKALKEARENDLIVVTCSSGMMGVGCPLGQDRNNPAHYRVCYFAQKYQNRIPAGILYIPIDNRTVANRLGNTDYMFDGKGGLSWGPPYIAGLMALGLQVNPDLTEKDLYQYLLDTGVPFNRGWVVNPKGFIERIKTAKNI